MARHAKLAYQTPDGADRELLLDDTTPVTIGRHPDCSITVTQPSVSRRHARIWHEAGGFCVEDLNSSNGTYINNQRVTKATLSDGCELRCGDFLMRYTTTPDFDDVAPPPLPSNRPRVVGSIRPRRSDEPAVVSARPTTNRPDLQLPLGDGAPMLRPVGPIDPARRVEEPSPRATGGDEDENARLRREVAHWRAQAEGRALLNTGAAGGDADQLRQTLADRERDIEERTRRINDLEGEVRRLGEQLKTQTDRALRLHEQAADLQGQLDAARRERSDLEMELADVRETLETLKGAQVSASGRELELAEAINDLKREVSQREKARRELERELQLVEYDLKSARDENENLRLAFGDDDQARKELNTTIDHLRQVVMEKESMIDTLQRDVERFEERLAQAKDHAKQDAGQRATRLGEDLAQAQADAQAQAADAAAQRAEVERLQAMVAESEQARRTENEAARVELERLRAEASEGGANAGRLRDMQEQLNRLKRENRDLRSDVEKVRAEGGATTELEAALQAAREARDAAAAEVERLRALPAPAAAAAQAAPAADTGGLLPAAVRTYEALNDLASDLRNNIRVGGDYVKELAGLLAVVIRDPANTAAIREAMDSVDAELTTESAIETLGNAQRGATDFKKLMRDFRDVLVQNGYEG
ncbi:MAG: FHA domain-containing protein [Myxococcales bacterium]|nr:FHA domain-containing protein [Myxococcales bacterium]